MKNACKKISQNSTMNNACFHNNTKVRYNINSSNTKPYDISKMIGKSVLQKKKGKEEKE